MSSKPGGKRYRVEIKPSAMKALRRIDATDRRRIVLRIDALADDPRPTGSVKLEGVEDVWRVRVGDYRILYQVEDDRLIVMVLTIGHRREVYR